MTERRIDPPIHSWRGEGDQAVCERCGIDVNDHIAAVAPCRIQPPLDSDALTAAIMEYQTATDRRWNRDLAHWLTDHGWTLTQHGWERDA